MRMRRSLMGPVLALTVLSARPAVAGNKPLAEQLFRGAQAIMQSTPTRDEFHQACMLYKESLDNDPAVNTQVALAACYEKEGKNVSAWGLYTDAAATGGPAGQYAKEHADALFAKGFLKLRFDSKALPAGAKVSLDGQPLGAAALSTAIDADPGGHTVLVRVDGAKDSEKKFELTPALSPLTLTLTPGAPEKSSATPASSAAVPTAVGGPAQAMHVGGFGMGRAPTGNDGKTDDDRPQTTGGGVRIAGIVLTILGGVLTIPTAVAFVTVGKSGQLPLPIGLAVLDVVLLTTGIVMIAAGGAKTIQPTASWHLAPVVGPTGGGALVTHAF